MVYNFGNNLSYSNQNYSNYCGNNFRVIRYFYKLYKLGQNKVNCNGFKIISKYRIFNNNLCSKIGIKG